MSKQDAQVGALSSDIDSALSNRNSKKIQIKSLYGTIIKAGDTSPSSLFSQNIKE